MMSKHLHKHTDNKQNAIQHASWLNKHIALSALFTLAVFIVFEVTDLDLIVQDTFYHQDTQQWWLSKQAPLARAIFYDAPKVLLILLAVTILITLTVRGISQLRTTPTAEYKRFSTQSLLIVFMTLAIVPSGVGFLKATTNSACPVHLQRYSGDIPYIKVLEAYPTGQKPQFVQKCFPAGHASGGFALLSLIFLTTRKRQQRTLLIGALAAGWMMGTYKMLIGDHFISHTLITMGLAWMCTCAIARAVYAYTPKSRLIQVSKHVSKAC